MTPDDPRHGERRGYYAGCRLECCRSAAVKYEKQRRLDVLRGKPARTVPAHGTRRRVQALARIGWSIKWQAEQLGISQQNLSSSLHLDRKVVFRDRHEAVTALYDRLCMTLGPSQNAAHRAARSGWPPPAAWTNPDNPRETGTGALPGVMLVREVGTGSLDAMRASHSAYRRGVRTPEIVAGEAAYQRWSHNRREKATA